MRGAGTLVRPPSPNGQDSSDLFAPASGPLTQRCCYGPESRSFTLPLDKAGCCGASTCPQLGQEPGTRGAQNAGGREPKGPAWENFSERAVLLTPCNYRPVSRGSHFSRPQRTGRLLTRYLRQPSNFPPAGFVRPILRKILDLGVNGDIWVTFTWGWNPGAVRTAWPSGLPGPRRLAAHPRGLLSGALPSGLGGASEWRPGGSAQSWVSATSGSRVSGPSAQETRTRPGYGMVLARPLKFGSAFLPPFSGSRLHYPFGTYFGPENWRLFLGGENTQCCEFFSTYFPSFGVSHTD